MRLALVLLLITAALVGCSTSTAHRVENRPMPVTAREMSLEQIERLIVAAETRRGWQFQQVEPGHLLATLERYGETAVADVFFTQRKFSIVYNPSSTGPRPTTTSVPSRGQTTARTDFFNYNRWIRNLEKDIRVTLDNTAPDAP